MAMMAAMAIERSKMVRKVKLVKMKVKRDKERESEKEDRKGK